MRFQTTIQRNKETIYKLLIDLQGYRSWLPSSEMYSETCDISESPAKVGTTYRDQGKASVMQGRVIELEPGQRITFAQEMKRKIAGIPSRLEIRACYTLKSSGEFSTQVTRELTIKAQGIFLLLQPLLLGGIRKENERIMQRLKWYLEAR